MTIEIVKDIVIGKEASGGSGGQQTTDGITKADISTGFGNIGNGNEIYSKLDVTTTSTGVGTRILMNKENAWLNKNEITIADDNHLLLKKSEIKELDSQTLSSANEYTNTELSNVVNEIKELDSQTLSSANEYTNTELSNVVNSSYISAFWFGKTTTTFVPPNPTSQVQNYFDFTNNTVYTALSNLSGWQLLTTINPLNGNRIGISSEFWDIPESGNMGYAIFNASKNDWDYFPEKFNEEIVNLIDNMSINKANTSGDNLKSSFLAGTGALTNAIIEAPNGILVQSNSNTLVLKAGVKILRPNGRSPNGTLLSMEYTVPQDYTLTLDASWNGCHGIMIQTNNGNIQSIRYAGELDAHPSTNIGGFYYNTMENNYYWWNGIDSWLVANNLFYLGSITFNYAMDLIVSTDVRQVASKIVTSTDFESNSNRGSSSGTILRSDSSNSKNLSNFIVEAPSDHVYYSGSTIGVLAGIKFSVGNGLNENGSFNNTIFTTPTSEVIDVGTIENNTNYAVLYAAVGGGLQIFKYAGETSVAPDPNVYGFYYDPVQNKNFVSVSGAWLWISDRMPMATFGLQNGVIYNFRRKNVLRIVTADNISEYNYLSNQMKQDILDMFSEYNYLSNQMKQDILDMSRPTLQFTPVASGFVAPSDGYVRFDTLTLNGSNAAYLYFNGVVIEGSVVSGFSTATMQRITTHRVSKGMTVTRTGQGDIAFCPMVSIV